MSIREFIFCDICNRQAVRTIELRRSPREGAERNGRRLCDGRSWFEGGLSAAIQVGWKVVDDQHICPLCNKPEDHE